MSKWQFLYSLRSPKILTFLALFIVLAAVPLTILVLKTQQNLEQRASLFECQVTTMAVEGLPNARKAIVTLSNPENKPLAYNAVKWYLDSSEQGITHQEGLTNEREKTFTDLPNGTHRIRAQYIVDRENNNENTLGESTEQKSLIDIPTSSSTEAELADEPTDTPQPSESQPSDSPTPTLSFDPVDCGISEPFKIGDDITPAPSREPRELIQGLRAAYFDNKDLTGTPKIRSDSNINFDWDTQNLPPGMDKTKPFSVRWQGLIKIDDSNKGGYYFYTRADDGVRLWIDDVKVIENWREHPEPIMTPPDNPVYLPPGNHRIKMEYFEVRAQNEGINHITRLRWSKVLTTNFGETTKIPNEILFHREATSPTPSVSKTPTPSRRLSPGPSLPPLSEDNGLNAYFFSNKKDPTANDTNDFKRKDSNINFNWDNLPEGDNLFSRINKNLFSVRWGGFIRIRQTGDYFFYTRADDGVRLWIDGKLVIDDWREHPSLSTQTSKKVTFDTTGDKRIRMEYFQIRDTNTTPTVTPSEELTPTPSVPEEERVGNPADHAIRLRWSKGSTASTFANATLIPKNILFIKSGISPTPSRKVSPTPSSRISRPPTGEPSPGTNKVILSLNIDFKDIATDPARLIHKQKQVTVCLYRVTANYKNDKNCERAAAEQTGPVKLDSKTGTFKNETFAIQKALQKGQYNILVLSPNYLRKRLTPAKSITTSSTINLSKVLLLPGDINDDGESWNRIDITDFNVLRNCGSFDVRPLTMDNPNSTFNKAPCTTHAKRAKADLNDDGVIDGRDFNIFDRVIGTKTGD